MARAPSGLAGAAFHHDRQDAALLALAHDHLRRRAPVGPRRLAGDVVGAAPAETFLADADAVAARLAVGHHQVEELLAAIDDDGAGLFLAVIGDLLRQEFRVELPLHLALGVHLRNRRGLECIGPLLPANAQQRLHLIGADRLAGADQRARLAASCITHGAERSGLTTTGGRSA